MQSRPNALERVRQRLLSGPIDLGLALLILGWRWIIGLMILYLIARLLNWMQFAP
jgi:hypothetical protein